MSDRIDALLAILRAGQDNALLRFSLGTEYLSQQQFDAAAEHLQAAVDLELTVGLLERLEDIDRPEDLIRAQAFLDGPASRAWGTHERQ